MRTLNLNHREFDSDESGCVIDALKNGRAKGDIGTEREYADNGSRDGLVVVHEGICAKRLNLLKIRIARAHCWLSSHRHFCGWMLITSDMQGDDVRCSKWPSFEPKSAP
jgi:hypothetical protein